MWLWSLQELYSSLHLFAQNGYETVSVSRIAGELGMTKGAKVRISFMEPCFFYSVYDGAEDKEKIKKCLNRP